MNERIGALLLMLALAGCSSNSDDLSKDAAKLVEFKQTATLTERWHVNVGDAGKNNLSPAIMSDAIYTANTKGQVFRLARTSGKRMWRIDSGFSISAGVGAGDGLVLIGGEKGELAAIAEDGTARWTTRVSSEVLSTPQIANGVIVVRTGDGRINGLDATDGKRLWLYERAIPSLIVRSHTGVLIQHGIVYAGFPGGKLAAIDLATGALKWEAIVSQPRGNTELERISDVISTPVTDGTQVCAVAFQGRIACFDLAQGNLLWSRELSSDKGISLLRDHLYVTDDKGAIHALDKNSGISIWKNDQLSLRRTSAPLIVGNQLLVGDFESYLHILNIADGALLARLKTDGSPVITPPLALDDGFLVQTHKGGLYSVAIH